MAREPMSTVNVRLPPQLQRELVMQAESERRTMRQLIRNACRLAMAERGYLDYTAVPEPLLERNYG